MKARFVFLVVGILFLASSLSAATLTAEEQQRVEFLRVLLPVLTGHGAPDWRAQLGLPDDFVIKCGTPYILEAQSLQRKAGQSLGLAVYWNRPDDILLDSYDSPGGHFRIHYTTEGSNATTLQYAQTVAQYAEDVYNHHIVQLGYHEPYPDGGFWFGGDDRYDIYLMDLGPGLYGLTSPDTSFAVGEGIKATSFLDVHTHYETFPGYGNNPLAALRVTLAHEFFHAIQFWYDYSEFDDETVEQTTKAHGWMEMSAVWMEEETYDDVNDYYYYLPYYIPHLEFPLRFFVPAGEGRNDWDEYYAYGAGLFPIFLTQVFGRDIIKTIWENCEPPHANVWYGAIQDAIDQHSNGTRTFADVFAEYGRWLYFTGSRKPYFFEEGAHYPEVPTEVEYADEMIPYIRFYDEYPTQVRSLNYRFFPYELGINYVDLDVSTLDSGITVDEFFGAGVSEGAEPPGWRVSAMAYNRFQPNLPVWVDDSLYSNHDEIIVDDVGGYTDVILTITTTNPYYNRANNAYQFTVYGEVLDIEGNKVQPPYPNPFNISTDDYLQVSVELLETQPVFMDVFNTAGEKVYSTEASGVRKPLLLWNGLNDHGQEVASGVYLLVVRIGDKSETLKALVIR